MILKVLGVFVIFLTGIVSVISIIPDENFREIFKKRKYKKIGAIVSIGILSLISVLILCKQINDQDKLNYENLQRFDFTIVRLDSSLTQANKTIKNVDSVSKELVKVQNQQNQFFILENQLTANTQRTLSPLGDLRVRYSIEYFLDSVADMQQVMDTFINHVNEVVWSPRRPPNGEYRYKNGPHFGRDIHNRKFAKNIQYDGTWVPLSRYLDSFRVDKFYFKGDFSRLIRDNYNKLYFNVRILPFCVSAAQILHTQVTISNGNTLNMRLEGMDTNYVTTIDFNKRIINVSITFQMRRTYDDGSVVSDIDLIGKTFNIFSHVPDDRLKKIIGDLYPPKFSKLEFFFGYNYSKAISLDAANFKLEGDKYPLILFSDKVPLKKLQYFTPADVQNF